jgi:predicted nucleotide-binding protein (sugar kinase/HSP70/actin superfamily)
MDEIFKFHSWDEVSEVIQELRERCEKVQSSANEIPNAIPVDKLKEVILIKRRIKQLTRQFDAIERSMSFLKTVPKVGKEAEIVAKKFKELHKTFDDLKDRIEKDLLGKVEK